MWLLEESGGDLVWKYVEVPGEGPEGRGWFPSASYTNENGVTQIILQGGLLTTNQRSDELWLLEIE